MIKSVLHIIFLFYLLHIQAQENLVPNGSFEEYNWCPYQDQVNNIDGFYITACKYWNMPTLGTSDYFNACSVQTDVLFGNYLFSVPKNYIGHQYARTGDGYAGMLYSEGNDTSFIGNSTYSEYIQVKLKHKLEKGKSYNLNFYVSNALNNLCGNTIGAYFSPNELNVLNDHNLEIIPQYQSDLSVFFCDTIKWFEHNYQFFSNGTEQFLIIGVFTKLPNSKTSDYDGNILSGPNPDQFGANQYLYVDDVSLIEREFNAPNVFTPNDDGINDILNFSEFSDEFSLTILNRWGEKVFHTDKANINFWNGKHQDKNCLEGTYFYILSNKDKIKKTGFIHLIR